MLSAINDEIIRLSKMFEIDSFKPIEIIANTIVFEVYAFCKLNGIEDDFRMCFDEIVNDIIWKAQVSFFENIMEQVDEADLDLFTETDDYIEERIIKEISRYWEG